MIIQDCCVTKPPRSHFAPRLKIGRWLAGWLTIPLSSLINLLFHFPVKIGIAQVKKKTKQNRKTGHLQPCPQSSLVHGTHWADLEGLFSPKPQTVSLACSVNVIWPENEAGPPGDQDRPSSKGPYYTSSLTPSPQNVFATLAYT